YAWVSIFQAVAKLGIVFLLIKSSFDKLLLYGLLLCLVTFVHLTIYIVLCYFKYPESRYRFYFERNRFKELMQFSGWNMFGTVAWASSEMLVNILLNNYFGVAVNAARGVAAQVSSGLGAFTQNFLTAARPQITKYWAVDERQHFYVLINRSAKAGFYLLFFVSLPVLIETEFVLTLWLKNVPENAIVFTRLVAVNALITAFSFPVVYAAQATGRLALFEVVGSGVRFLVFPLSWVFLSLGYPPQITMQIAIVITALCLALRLLILRRIAKLPLWSFISNVIFPASLIALVSCVAPLWISANMTMGVKRFLVVGCACVLATGISILGIGLTGAERNAFWNIAKRKFGR
ncbi:MAG: hypothetical protein PHE03_10395, partial [Bacteroidales bacterium]|nr:hypothetical protein [Bacteroidales bacterium]